MTRYTCNNQHALFAALYDYLTGEGFTAADGDIPAGGAAALKFDEFGCREFTAVKKAMHATTTDFHVEEYDPAYDMDKADLGDMYVCIKMTITPTDSTWPFNSPIRVYNAEFVSDAIDNAWWYVNHLFDDIALQYDNEPDGWDRPYIQSNIDGDGRIHIRADLRIYDCTDI